MKIIRGLFARIDKRLARLAVIEKHYLHRSCSFSWAFGIIIDEKVKGVLTVGKPCSRTVLNGVCGPERAADVYELNRLWVDKSLPCNTESEFVGWCLRQLRMEHRHMILVSYADTKPSEGAKDGHIGYVYQATNWIYTGTNVQFADKVRGQKIERSTKHRYVFFLHTADRKFLRWETVPYPKRSKRKDKAHLKIVCRYEFVTYQKHGTAPETIALATPSAASVGDASPAS